MKIGIALSGGGVLGAAHVGVLEELEKADIKIDYISGCSAGSIIGALYACKGLDGIEEFFTDIEAKLIKNRQISNFNPKKVLEVLEFSLLKNLEGFGFSNTNIKYSCVATDMQAGENKLFDTGHLVKAVIASSAYPGVFPVQIIDEVAYADGGISKNLPADVVKDMCDFVIGSSIYNADAMERTQIVKMNSLQIMKRTLDILQKELSESQEQYCDFVFKPNVEKYRWYDFGKLRTIEEEGRALAKKRMPELKKLLSK